MLSSSIFFSFSFEFFFLFYFILLLIIRHMIGGPKLRQQRQKKKYKLERKTDYVRGKAGGGIWFLLTRAETD